MLVLYESPSIAPNTCPIVTMYVSFSAATAQIEMHCVERVFGDNNKQGIVVSSSATYESMQVLLSEHCKKNVV